MIPAHTIIEPPPHGVMNFEGVLRESSSASPVDPLTIIVLPSRHIRHSFENMTYANHNMTYANPGVTTLHIGRHNPADQRDVELGEQVPWLDVDTDV